MPPVIPNTVPVDADILRLVQEALKVSADLPAMPTYQQLAKAVARAAGAEMRLQLWLRDCVPEAVKQ